MLLRLKHRQPSILAWSLDTHAKLQRIQIVQLSKDAVYCLLTVNINYQVEYSKWPFNQSNSLLQGIVAVVDQPLSRNVKNFYPLLPVFQASLHLKAKVGPLAWRHTTVEDEHEGICLFA